MSATARKDFNRSHEFRRVGVMSGMPRAIDHDYAAIRQSRIECCRGIGERGWAVAAEDLEDRHIDAAKRFE